MSDTHSLALRVLVVDDEPDSADSLALVLNLWCYEVRTAPNGESALEAGREFVPDVVLMDLGMTGLDGWEAARRLREEPGMRDSLFVAVTGFGLEADRRRSREAGFDHHLVKPVEPEVLLRLLEDARLARTEPAYDSKPPVLSGVWPLSPKDKPTASCRQFPRVQPIDWLVQKRGTGWPPVPPAGSRTAAFTVPGGKSDPWNRTPFGPPISVTAGRSRRLCRA